MKLVSVLIENFRCYKDQVIVPIDNLTTLIGKNDIGKSTVLEALEIFFNNELIKIDATDAYVYTGNKMVTIACEFSDLPNEIILDATSKTDLKNEYLVSKNETLIIFKHFDCSKATPSVEISILANHPTVEGANNLLELKEKELQSIIKQRGLDAALKGNPEMRAAIWSSYEDLALEQVFIPVSKPKEDSKRIWEQIDSYLPIYALFQSDRSSQDKDKEVQNPMKVAIAAAIAEVKDDIDRIQRKVQEKAEEIAKNTHEALKQIDSSLASKLEPQFIMPTASKWIGLFNINMDTDDGISLNKRGSGVRRMILVSFFKAEAERRLKSGNKRSIIYALEEPETAQHPNNQKILIESFKQISENVGCQVLLTTHSLRGSQSNIDHSCDLAAIPSPEYDHPIGFSSQCDQVVLLVLRKSTRYKLLGLVLGLTFLISFKKRSPHLLVLDFVDCPDCTGCSLANGQEFLGGGDCKAG